MPADRRTRLFSILGATYDTPGTPASETIRRLEDRVLEMDDQWREMMSATEFTGVRLASNGVKPETTKPTVETHANKSDGELRGRARAVAAIAKDFDAPRGYALPDLDQ